MHQSTYPSLRKLEGVIMKLEPISEQNALLGFLRNVDNAKALTGFVQELADAITDYQVRAISPNMTFCERLARFQSNKEYMRGQGRSMKIPRGYMVVSRMSMAVSRMSTVILRGFVMILRTS